MLIIASSKIRLERVLTLAAKASWILTLAFCAFFALFTVISLYQGGESERDLRKDISGLLRPQTLPLEKIGQGSLSLKSNKRKMMLPDMSQEIVLLTKNVRPDLNAKEMGFLFSLRSSGAEHMAKNGEVIFLSCDPQTGGSAPVYRFSDRKTPLWMKPSFLDRSKVLVEVGLFMPSKDSEGFLEERAQFVVQEDSLKEEGRFQGESWLSSLREAKLWGPDVIFSKYREKEYGGLSRKSKIEISGKKGTSFCFMQQGGFLVWDAEMWVPIEDEGKAFGRPLAQVKSISPREIEFEVWNEEGFYPQVIKLEMQNPSRVGALKPDQIPQLVRARTTHQVSCSFAKRRYLMKPGDWILKTSRGWKVLKRSLDIEEYLLHKVRGDLCIFDSLVKEQGQLIMKGFWVDEMRTQTYPFAVSVEGDHFSHRSLRKEKKRLALKKTEGAVTTYLPFAPQEIAEDFSDE